MSGKKSSKFERLRAFLAGFLVFIGIFTGVGSTILQADKVYAISDNEETVLTNPSDTENDSNTQETDNTTESDENTSNNEATDTQVATTDNKSKGDTCKDSLGALGWLVCPATGAIAKGVDFLYNLINGFLVINPISTDDGTPVYEIWKYCRGITNIVFIIFLLIVIYSQITGIGISNYGIKKSLPKLIVAAILVNLSFVICLLAVDASNIVGNSLRGLFTSIQETTLAASSMEAGAVSYTGMYSAIAGGSVLAIGGAMIAFEAGAIWMLIPTALGALVAAVTGLITIALRQAVVVLLIMIAPLAMVANILPNTEKWFKKWKDLLTRMLVFYPMFSLLFGASSLAGFAIMMSAKSGWGLLLGTAVQIFPLFFSWSLMKMSGTFLGDINSKMRGLTAKPLAAHRAWADSHRQVRRGQTIASGVTPSAKLMQFMEKRRSLREEDIKNLQTIASGKATEYVQRKIAGSTIGDTTSRTRRTPRYTQNAKAARNYELISSNAKSHTDHVMGHYGSYFNNSPLDRRLNQESQRAWIDYGRAAFQKEMDDEDDTNFLVNKYLEATKRDANGRPVDEEAFDRYMRSVAGPTGEQRLSAKIIAQAAKVESKQRAEYHILTAKYGHNGYNKREFRNWAAGYNNDDDGWAVDRDGKRLRNEDGSYVEVIQGDALTKAPEKLVLYDKRDEYGLYFDFKDQDGNVIARIHRGRGADGQNHDDAAFIKEVLSNYDIPIADPINNIYGILSGIKPGSIQTPQGMNEIGLSRYSTTIGGAMKDYKGNAAWAGAMFNSGIGNRQIRSSAHYAIWVLDSIVKTLKPGAYNTQNPASVELITAILDPDNWEKIFTEEEIASAININNKSFGGEEWELDEQGNVVRDGDGNIVYHPVENPTYEQRMNTLKRKFLFPAMKKVLPSFDRLRTSNTADNQKPGTADAQFEFLKMVKEKWEDNPAIDFDPTLVDQDLQFEARAFRQRKHDRDGNLIYPSDNTVGRRSDAQPVGNLLALLEEVYDRSMMVEDLKRGVFSVLNEREEYSRALQRFDELCTENPDATMNEMLQWFVELDTLVRYE